jgi:hypothetical protein
MQLIDRTVISSRRAAARLFAQQRVITVFFSVVLAATTAMAQQAVNTTSEDVVTRRDLNGRETVTERVLTHHARTGGEERVVIESYLPAEYADRLALSRRVRRLTTATDDGSRTVEEIEESNPASRSEPMRVVQRSVTTVRRSGSDSSVTERQLFERDPNGQLVLVEKQTGSAPRD